MSYTSPPITCEISGVEGIDASQAVVSYASDAVYYGSLPWTASAKQKGTAAKREGKALGQAYGLAMHLVDDCGGDPGVVRHLLEAGVQLGRVQS